MGKRKTIARDGEKRANGRLEDEMETQQNE
jgi:hypothetical protein